MSNRHFAVWPKKLPKLLTLPETSLYANVEISARRYPNKPFILFYDTPITYSEFQHETEALAGYLQQECGIKKGDRVLLYMQNCPQYIISYYGILRANAVVVPINPMNLAEELKHYISDTGASTIIVAGDLYGHVKDHIHPGQSNSLSHVVVSTYSDYLKSPTDLKVPDFIKAPSIQPTELGVVSWSEAITKNITIMYCRSSLLRKVTCRT